MPSPDTGASIEAERVRALFAQLPQSAAGSILVALWFGYVFGGVVALPLLVSWGLAMVLNSVWRLWLWRRFNVAQPAAGDTARWRNQALAGMMISIGLLGASGVLFFVSGQPVLQIVLAVALTVMVAGSVTSTAIYLPFAYAAVLMLIGPLTVRFALDDAAHHGLVVLGLALAIPVVFRFAKTFAQTFSRLLATQAENTALIVSLQLEKAVAVSAQKTAEEANLAKTRFFAAASHDLRQPVHALALFAAALQEKSREPEVAHVVNSINASVGALEGLFSELLDISKIDAGAVTANPGHFSVQSIFEKLRMDFEPEAFEKNLVLRIHTTGFFAYSDALLVERILRNLTANALRYTEAGGVLIGCRKAGGGLQIEVWDTGIGITPADQARVFDEFYQIGSLPAQRTKGMGLGLAIVKRLAEILDAKVTLQSVPGKGTLFRVLLPLGRAPAASAAPIPATATVPVDLKGRRIVVVEDETAVVEGMRVLLAGWGAEVMIAESAAAAEDLLTGMTIAPDLVIADYRLGGAVTGVDVIERFRSKFSNDLPAIVVTGSTTPTHLAQAQVKNFHLMLKPVMPAKLRTLINFKLRG